jgi:hypothetical protein
MHNDFLFVCSPLRGGCSYWIFIGISNKGGSGMFTLFLLSFFLFNQAGAVAVWKECVAKHNWAPSRVLLGMACWSGEVGISSHVARYRLFRYSRWAELTSI